MDFYPVYRLCRSNGSFSRIGSLLQAGERWTSRIAPHIRELAMTLFERKPGDVILLGPRSSPDRVGAIRDEDR